MDKTWNALANESALAAEHIGIGVTAIGRSNYAHKAFYDQAFFALSVGFERTAKIALVLTHALDHGGQYPDTGFLRKYGHDLDTLLADVDGKAAERGLEGRLPRSDIHRGIIDTLNEFATNRTRYYNLELVTKAQGQQGAKGPIETWHARVTQKCLTYHYKERYRRAHGRKAALVGSMMDHASVVMHTAEDGRELRSIKDLAIHGMAVEFAIPCTFSRSPVF